MITVGSWIRTLAVVLLASFFLVAPVFSLLHKGPFSWHIEQPQAWQGGGEVLALVVLLFGALSLPWRRIGLGLAVLFGWLYARRHGIDLSVVIELLYAEGMLALGWTLLPRIGMLRFARSANLLTAGLLGVIAWSLVIWIMSAVDIGYPDAIRLIAVSVLGLAIVVSPGPRLAAVLAKAAQGPGHMKRLFVALIGAFVLAMFAKAAVVVDFDSIWYGLRAEQVLTGEGSLFAPQGLISVVHYYPKLFEALQLPFAGLDSVSLIFGAGIFSSLMVALTCATILREYKVGSALRYAAAAVITTLPALANIAVTAKGDAFSSWLVLLSLLALIRFRKGLGSVWFWVSLSSLTLAVLARLSNLPYASLMFVLLTGSAIQRGWLRAAGSRLIDPGIWLGAATGLLGGLVLLRTYLLTGVFLVAPNSVVNLQRHLGLQLKFPVGSLPSADVMSRFPVIEGMRGMLFDPADLPHIMITWPGNVWAFLPVVALLLGVRRTQRRPETWLLLVLGASFFAVLFGYKLLVPGGDGNYFIVPVACLTLFGVIQMARLPDAPRRWLAAGLFVFALAGAAISFITGSWGPGTRALDMVMTRMPFEFAPKRAYSIGVARLKGVESYFQGMSPATRVVGLEAAGIIPESVSGFWLPIRYEPLDIVAWSLPESMRSSASLADMLVRSEIAYVVVPVHSASPSIELLLRESLMSLQAGGRAKSVYKDADYEIWRLLDTYTAHTKLKGGGDATVSIALEQFCASPNNAVAVVDWSAQASSVAIEVEAEGNRQPLLWAMAGSQGRQESGPWVGPGSDFIFRRGRDGEVLGRVEVNPICR